MFTPSHYQGKFQLNGEMAGLDETLSTGEGASFPRSQTWHPGRDKQYLVSTRHARPG